MDPFSITVGVVGLADAGTSLASFLTDKYKTYREAPSLILEIASEVEFCAGLVDIFGSSLDRPGSQYPDRFVRDAKNLVQKTHAVFLDIRGLIPVDRDFDATFSRARWHFVLDRKKLEAQRQRLRELQQMFMFMETMYRYHCHSGGTSGPGAGANEKVPVSDEGEQKFQGVVDQQGPMRLSGVGADGRSFEVTLTLKPVPQRIEVMPMSAPMSDPGITSRMSGSSVVPERSSQSRKRLEGLRRSPFFDRSLLEDEKSKARTYVQREYVEAMPATYSRSSHNRTDSEKLAVEHEARQKIMEEKSHKTSEQGAPQSIVLDDGEAERDVNALSRLVRLSPSVRTVCIKR